MKFLVDSMLGKLARFLRIFGYDTIYSNDLTDRIMIDPVPDEKLIYFAKKNDRFIITKDLMLHKSFIERSLYLQGEGIYHYLNQLKRKLNLNFEFSFECARCSICNSILLKVQDKTEIEDFVLPDSFNNYSEFYRCTNLICKKVFWKGTHIEDIEKKLEGFSLLP